MVSKGDGRKAWNCVMIGLLDAQNCNFHTVACLRIHAVVILGPSAMCAALNYIPQTRDISL